MHIDVLTLFPRMFSAVLGESMLKRAQAKGLVRIDVHDIRGWADGAHRTADDTPYGGGPGMVMKIEPVYRALKDIVPAAREKGKARRKAGRARVILLTPQGKRYHQKTARELAREERLVLICGHYEGVDERIRQLATDEISVGDYVLTCGELPAMVLVDSVVRLVPGVVGDPASLREESFEEGLLEYPQYTRPAAFKGMKVPRILLSGDHGAIRKWRLEESLKRTRRRRPDLLEA